MPQPSTPGGGSTLSHLLRQSAARARTALQLGITGEPRGGQMKRVVPAQPAKTEGITQEEDMLSAVRTFLERFSGIAK